MCSIGINKAAVLLGAILVLLQCGQKDPAPRIEDKQHEHVPAIADTVTYLPPVPIEGTTWRFQVVDTSHSYLWINCGLQFIEYSFEIGLNYYGFVEIKSDSLVLNQEYQDNPDISPTRPDSLLPDRSRIVLLRRGDKLVFHTRDGRKLDWYLQYDLYDSKDCQQ